MQKLKDKHNLLLFFIYPFAGFLFALKNLRSNYSHIIICLFCILFGFTFNAVNESEDSFRYIQEFHNNMHQSRSSYLDELSSYLSFAYNTKDFFAQSSYFLVSRFTFNYHYLMMLWAVFFSLFYILSFKFLVNLEAFRRNIYYYLIAFLFTFSNPIYNINGIRFWLAAWIAVYTVFQICINKNYKYLLLSLLTPFVHGTYIVFVLLLFIAMITKKYFKFWKILFIISFFLSELVYDFLASINEYLPLYIQNLIWSYTESDYIMDKVISAQSLPLYARILNFLPELYINSLLILLISKIKISNDENITLNLFSFTLCWFTFCNFTASVPSLGNRFLFLGIPLVCYLWIKNEEYLYKYKYLIYLIPFVYSYNILYWIRKMYVISDPILYLFNSVQILITNS